VSSLENSQGLKISLWNSCTFAFWKVKVQEFHRDIFRPWEFSKLDTFFKSYAFLWNFNNFNLKWPKSNNFCIKGALYGFWLTKIRKEISRVKMRPRKKMNLMEEYLPLQIWEEFNYFNKFMIIQNTYIFSWYHHPPFWFYKSGFFYIKSFSLIEKRSSTIT
jgi:hypothetical protein